MKKYNIKSNWDQFRKGGFSKLLVASFHLITEFGIMYFADTVKALCKYR